MSYNIIAAPLRQLGNKSTRTIYIVSAATQLVMFLLILTAAKQPYPTTSTYMLRMQTDAPVFGSEVANAYTLYRTRLVFSPVGLLALLYFMYFMYNAYALATWQVFCEAWINSDCNQFRWFLFGATMWIDMALCYAISGELMASSLILSILLYSLMWLCMAVTEHLHSHSETSSRRRGDFIYILLFMIWCVVWWPPCQHIHINNLMGYTEAIVLLTLLLHFMLFGWAMYCRIDLITGYQREFGYSMLILTKSVCVGLLLLIKVLN